MAGARGLLVVVMVVVVMRNSSDVVPAPVGAAGNSRGAGIGGGV